MKRIMIFALLIYHRVCKMAVFMGMLYSSQSLISQDCAAKEYVIASKLINEYLYINAQTSDSVVTRLVFGWHHRDIISAIYVWYRRKGENRYQMFTVKGSDTSVVYSDTVYCTPQKNDLLNRYLLFVGKTCYHCVEMENWKAARASKRKSHWGNNLWTASLIHRENGNSLRKYRRRLSYINISCISLWHNFQERKIVNKMMRYARSR